MPALLLIAFTEGATPRPARPLAQLSGQAHASHSEISAQCGGGQQSVRTWGREDRARRLPRVRRVLSCVTFRVWGDPASDG